MDHCLIEQLNQAVLKQLYLLFHVIFFAVWVLAIFKIVLFDLIIEMFMFALCVSESFVYQPPLLLLTLHSFLLLQILIYPFKFIVIWLPSRFIKNIGPCKHFRKPSILIQGLMRMLSNKFKESRIGENIELLHLGDGFPPKLSFAFGELFQ